MEGWKAFVLSYLAMSLGVFLLGWVWAEVERVLEGKRGGSESPPSFSLSYHPGGRAQSGRVTEPTGTASLPRLSTGLSRVRTGMLGWKV